MIVGVLTTILNTNNAPLYAGIAAAEGAMRGHALTMSTILKGATIGAGIAAAAGMVLAVKAAADFQDAFAGVRKTVDEADLAAAGLTFEQLGMQFRSMATEIPIAATELAAIGEAAGALGIKAIDIEAFTRTVALLGATTNLTTAGAAESLGKIGTILDLTGGEFATFGDILVALGNNGASTESEIIEVTKRFAAAGVQAGLSTGEILAFSSAIASAGVEPEAAGSSLSRLFSNLVLETANATAKGKAFAEVTGKSFKDFSEIVRNDTVGAMMLFLSQLSDLDKFAQAQALRSVGIVNVRDVNAIRLLAATYETNLIPAIQTAATATGALTEEAQKRFDTFNSKLTLLGNNFTELAITIGTALLPPMTSLVTEVSKIVQGVTAWATANPGLAGSILPVVAGVALLLAGILAVNVAIGILALLLSPVGIALALIGGIIVLVASNFDNLQKGVQVVIDTIQRLIDLAARGADAVSKIPGVELVGDVARNVSNPPGGVRRNPLIEGIRSGDGFQAGKRPLEFAHGGIVPGVGPQLIVAHGGETVTPAGAGTTLTHTTILQLDGRVLAEVVEQLQATREGLVTVLRPGTA